jgi:hypothetical protein
MAQDTVTTTTRPMRVCGYIDRALPDLMAALASDGIEDTLARALAEAVAVDIDHVTVTTTQPVAISASTAEVTATWEVSFSRSRRQGSAKVDLLMVQSGHEPVTEVLVTMSVIDGEAEAAASATHRFLDQLTLSLG